jgi:hypothetical protein
MRDASCVLLDATGRKVADLHPGANDVSRIPAGVYFICEEDSRGPAFRSRTQKIVKLE